MIIAYVEKTTNNRLGIAYKEAPAQLKRIMFKMLDDFSAIIQSKSKKLTKNQIGDSKAITVHELRELYNAVNQFDGKVIKADGSIVEGKNVAKGTVKIGNRTYNVETIQSLLLYASESGGRPSEIVPTQGFLREIGYDKAFKDFQKSDKYKKAQEKRDKEDGGEGGTGGTPIQRIDISKLCI